MYRLVKNSFGEISSEFVQRVADFALIKTGADNTDYQQYLAWLAEGNEPLPADEAEPKLEQSQ